jgi:hypothetical protein
VFGRGPLFKSLLSLRLGTLGWGYLHGSGIVWSRGRLVGTRASIIHADEPIEVRTLPLSWTYWLRAVQLWLG